jgi:3',5'-cyclic AMP phosphodiesterase CpdA
MLTWVHFGDLHASDEDGWNSLERVRAMVGETERNLASGIDFAVLPGDNANHAEPEQYRRIGAVLGALQPRVFVIPGDHDFETGTLTNFYDGLGARQLPFSVVIKGHRCLFLDIVSSGGGGPDFRLGPTQTAWIRDQLEHAKDDPERSVVFMHAFPGDLAEGGEALARDFAQYDVACVDTGHTHYNEVLNDGGVIYTATRSTGQIEEGPVGFSLHTVDGSVTAWRFKPLDQPWPFVLITSPADRRLVMDPAQTDQAPQGAFTVRAKVFGDPSERVALRVNDGDPIPMRPAPGEVGVWTAPAAVDGGGVRRLSVTGWSADGRTDSDTIELQPGTVPPAPRALKARPGDHVHSIGAWPERGLLGTQLGPNKNGKIKW